MRTLKLNPAAFPAQLRADGKRFALGVRRGMLSAAQRGLVIIQQRVRTAGPANPSGKGSGGAVNTAAYLRSWKVSSHGELIRLFSDSPYAGTIEFGRRAGKMPPVAPLARWAQRRLGLTRKQALGIGFAIAKSIGKRGLLARYVLSGGMPQLKAAAVEEIKREMRKAFEE